MKKLMKSVAALSLFTLSGPLLASNYIANSPALTLDGAKIIADAAAQKAQAENWNVVIVITDASGDLKYLERMEDVQLASLEVAINKAKTSVLYRRPTEVFSEGIKSGNMAFASLPDVLPYAGGLPIQVDGHTIGAIGVSGVKDFQDAEIAQAGIDALLKQLNKQSAN